MLLKIKQTLVIFPLLHLHCTFCYIFVLLNGPWGLTGHCLWILSVSCILKSSTLVLGMYWFLFCTCIHFLHSISYFLCIVTFVTLSSGGMGKADHDLSFSYGSGFGHEVHLALYFCRNCWKRGALFPAGIPNLVEWSWSCWWLILPAWEWSQVEESGSKGNRSRFLTMLLKLWI